MTIGIIKALVLGVVEGITEFLPISSTGHLILVNEFVSFDKAFTEMFDIVIQLGAILAVVFYFWNKLWPFGKPKEEMNSTLSIWWKTLVGVLPAIAFGALFAKVIEEKLFNPWIVATTLIIGGIFLVYIERRKKESKMPSVHEITYQTALYIGFIQCLAMIPGTSRSAATIIGAMLLGASRIAAVEFSFFLAIPTMVAASAYSLLKHGSAMSSQELVFLTVGFITAFITAFAVIRFFMNYIKTKDFKPFGYYRIILGILVLIFFLFK